VEQLQEIITKIGFDWRLALANLFNFLIIFWLLKRYFFGPLAEIVNERRSRIEGGLRDAKAAEDALVAANVEEREIIAVAKKEAEEIINQARMQARLLEERAKKKIITLRDDELAKAAVDIVRDKEELMAIVKESAGELVARGMRQALKEELDTTAQMRITNTLMNI